MAIHAVSTTNLMAALGAPIQTEKLSIRVCSCFVRGTALPSDPMDASASLRPATPEEIGQALAHALRYEGRKRVHTGDEFMARITAERLVKYLELAGFVLMKKAPAAPHRAG